jgi:hypothetical protein
MWPPQGLKTMTDNHPRRRVMAVIGEYALISSEIKSIVLAAYAPATAGSARVPVSPQGRAHMCRRCDHASRDPKSYPSRMTLPPARAPALAWRLLPSSAPSWLTRTRCGPGPLSTATEFNVARLTMSIYAGFTSINIRYTLRREARGGLSGIHRG